MRHVPTRAPRALLFAAAVTLLAACDSTPSLAPADDSAADTPGAFSAQVVGAEASLSLSGSVEVAQSTDGADFTGAFNSYPILRRDSTRNFHFTMIRLFTGEGEGLMLGHVSPTADLPSGAYGIEPGRDLRPPYGFVARYFERGEGRALRQFRVTGGRVQVESGEARLRGRFELTLDDGRTLTGTFAAGTRR